MQTVAVVFLLAPEGGAVGALVGGAEAVAPVVGVGEAAAGPAEDGRLDGPHGVDEVEPDAVPVGDFRSFADPDAVVDDAAELLDEVRVDFGGDGAEGLRGDDVDGGVGGAGDGLGGRVAGQGGRCGGEGGGLEEAAAVQRGHGFGGGPWTRMRGRAGQVYRRGWGVVETFSLDAGTERIRIR